jgi:hypothetical protein
VYEIVAELLGVRDKLLDVLRERLLEPRLVWGLGVGVQGSGFSVQRLGFRVQGGRVEGVTVQGQAVQGLGLRSQG